MPANNVSIDACPLSEVISKIRSDHRSYRKQIGSGFNRVPASQQKLQDCPTSRKQLAEIDGSCTLPSRLPRLPACQDLMGCLAVLLPPPRTDGDRISKPEQASSLLCILTQYISAKEHDMEHPLAPAGFGLAPKFGQFSRGCVP